MSTNTKEILRYFIIDSNTVDVQHKKQNENIKHCFNDYKEKHPECNYNALIKSEFKYIRLNIDNRYQLEGKVKIDYMLYKNQFVVPNQPNPKTDIMFKSIYNNIDTLNIKDVLKEIYTNIKGKTLISTYKDTNENILQDFADAYIKNIDEIFDMSLALYDDTIDIKKVGNIIQVKTYNTVDNDRHEARELVSYIIDETSPVIKFKTTKEIIENKLLDFDYSQEAVKYNDTILKKLHECYDNLQKVEPNVYTEEFRNIIVNQLYENEKINL